MTIRVAIVDPHEIMRVGIKHLCIDRSEFEFAGELDSLLNGCERLIDTRPDVVVIDPGPSDELGLAIIRQIHEQLPAAKILVFASRDCGQFALEMMAAGASGYVTKAAAMDEIAVAIRAVESGRLFISHHHQAVDPPKAAFLRRAVVDARSDLNPSVLQANGGPLDSVSRADGPHGLADANDVNPLCEEKLSGREREVLLLLAEGMTNRQAAEQLFLSVKTVETYRSRIMRKFGLRDRLEMVRFARKLTPPIAS